MHFVGQDYSEMQGYLYSLRHHGAKYGIDRMRVLVDRLGNPERSYPIIHVAGTNGKGSVCAMLESIYRGSGLKTGMFTSPHLVDLEERFQVNRENLGRDEMVEYVDRLKVVGEALGEVHPDDQPSFFEVVNAIAFLYFEDAGVDLAIVETGLGGELDSTNVCEPLVSVITSISRDHTEILGNSIEDIARAKGGIVKAGKPVVLGVMCEEAEQVLRGIAESKGSQVYTVRERFGEDVGEYPETNLGGVEQRRNAATAVLVSEVLGETFPVKGVEEALMRVKWAARWQEVGLSDGRKLILDCTHNEEGGALLAKNLEGLKEKPVVVFGALSELRAQALVPMIAKYAEEIVFVKPHQFRAVGVEGLKRYVPEDFKGVVSVGKVDRIFGRGNVCYKDTGGRGIVATGSLYLMGEIMGRFVA